MKPFVKLVVPEPVEILLFIAMALGLLLLQSAKRFWDFYVHGIGIGSVAFDASGGLDTIVRSWYLRMEQHLDPRFADFAVWIMVGCVVFTIITYISSAVRNADEEVHVLRNYRVSKNRVREFDVFIARVALRLTGIMMLLIWATVFLGEINPTFTQLFFYSIVTLGAKFSWLWLAVSVVAMTLSIYMFAIILRIVALRPRVFGESVEE